MSMPSNKAVLGYLAAVFVAGLAIGGLTGYTVARTTPTEIPTERKLEDRWLDEYRSQLGLTAEQVEAVRPLLPEAVERLGGIWYRAIMTMGAIQENVDRQVEPLLDDSQRGKLDAWIREKRAERLRIAYGRSADGAPPPDKIWFAAATGDLDAIRRHLANGVDVNAPSVAFGMPPLVVAAVHGQPDAVDLLVESGAHVNQRTADGNTALHGAAFFGRAECVRRLLAHGADSNLKNYEGKTALEGMEADWETIQFIGTILELRLEKERTLAGRAAVAQLLRQREENP